MSAITVALVLPSGKIIQLIGFPALPANDAVSLFTLNDLPSGAMSEVENFHQERTFERYELIELIELSGRSAPHTVAIFLGQILCIEICLVNNKRRRRLHMKVKNVRTGTKV